jgi:hypothetical protein
LAQSAYRPKPIVELQAEIEGEIRAAEVNHSVTGVVDQARVDKILGMRLRLDYLCSDWIAGRIT